ncbi:MAG: DNA-directed RNA polymerase subunit alpha [Parcubacteria group bacterium GW2011_GWF2_38_76]|nr:MAG: DNA-directed RNA polymerase subunit alpha [Parcubacteria group bacterium GW2011_GWF2_38_76]HBM46012.1 DNA-directed RNA polymerase subunit alpha [Patescibacteria group bacterium]
MLDFNIVLPSKPRVFSETELKGVYEIDGLYPGYGHTLGNSLRRIILSSLPGATITSVKIEGADHEFSTLDGIKEDVIAIVLHLKKLRFKVDKDEPQVVYLKASGIGEVKAESIEDTSAVKILNPEQLIATITDKNTKLNIELTVEKGLGFVPKELIHKDKVEIGTIAVDAAFSPIRRVNYEVENMRVGDRTDYNRLRIFIETDGTLTPRQALERSIEIMISQLKSIIGFVDEEEVVEEIKKIEEPKEEVEEEVAAPEEKKFENQEEVLKMRIEDLKLSNRTMKALSEASIRTVGGLARKKEEDLLEIAGLGGKGITEIKKVLGNLGITLK